MAQKVKQEIAIPDGTLQQRVQVSALRSDIELLKSIRELDRSSVTASILQGEETHSIDRMRILLQDAYNLKFLLCDPDPDIREKMGGININEAPITPESLSKKMSAVSEAKLADDSVMLELLKRGIELREKLICATVRRLRKRKTPDQEITQDLISTTYQLVLLKSFASNPSMGKQMMKDFYHQNARLVAGLRGAESRYDFIENLVQCEITKSPQERASNIREGFSNLSSLFASAEEKTAKICSQLDEISKNEARLLRVLSNAHSKDTIERLGINRSFSEDVFERAETHIPALDALIRKKEARLRNITASIASGSKEAATEEFSGLGKKRLKQLAVFWEDLREHPIAPWRLSHIYAEMGEWKKAKKWLEEDIDRGFAILDYDSITRSLKFGQNIAGLSGDGEWARDLSKRLAAHLSVPNYQFLSEAVRGMEKDESDSILDGYN